jgi:hypothetical protein
VAIAAVVVFLGHSPAQAEYISLSVPLDSQFAGPNVGTVLVEVNGGSTAVKGLQPGQAQLTFAVNPAATPFPYFTEVEFHFNGRLNQIVAPQDWLVRELAQGDGSVPGTPFWGPVVQIGAIHASHQNPLIIRIDGLGSLAMLSSFMSSAGYPPNTMAFTGEAHFPGPEPGAISLALVEGTVSTPEPSTLAMAAWGLAGALLAQRWRMNSRRSCPARSFPCSRPN